MLTRRHLWAIGNNLWKSYKSEVLVNELKLEFDASVAKVKGTTVSHYIRKGNWVESTFKLPELREEESGSSSTSSTTDEEVCIGFSSQMLPNVAMFTIDNGELIRSSGGDVDSATTVTPTTGFDKILDEIASNLLRNGSGDWRMHVLTSSNPVQLSQYEADEYRRKRNRLSSKARRFMTKNQNQAGVGVEPRDFVYSLMNTIQSQEKYRSIYSRFKGFDTLPTPFASDESLVQIAILGNEKKMVQVDNRNAASGGGNKESATGDDGRRFKNGGNNKKKGKKIKASVGVMKQVLKIGISVSSPSDLQLYKRCISQYSCGIAPSHRLEGSPSSAYMKLIDAQAHMGIRFKPNELVVDLGASPGGWTSIALDAGCRVVAVDRSPLDPSLMSHSCLQQFITGDAFTFHPRDITIDGSTSGSSGKLPKIDWLMCDVIAGPERTFSLLKKAITKQWCKYFIFTFKFRGDPDVDYMHHTVKEFLRESNKKWQEGRRSGHGSSGSDYDDDAIDFRIRRFPSHKNEMCVFGEIRD